VLHAIAGPTDANTFLREARWVVDGVKAALPEMKRSGLSIKAQFRKWHSERLRAEHGMMIEPTAFDPPAPQDESQPLSFRDPTGKAVSMMLPAPPLDGPDVTFDEGAQKARSTPGVEMMEGPRGKRFALSNQGRVHALLAHHAMQRIERLYGTVFETILAERITTQPVMQIGGIEGRRGELCLHCQSRTGAAPADGD
jgi:hypothetical protein